MMAKRYAMLSAALAMGLLALSCRLSPRSAASRSDAAVDGGASTGGDRGAALEINRVARDDVVATSAPGASVTPASVAPAVIRLPRGERGIGFDDLAFAHGLRQVLVPSGGTGRVNLIDPDSFAVTSLEAGPISTYAGGHDNGVTSADS